MIVARIWLSGFLLLGVLLALLGPLVVVWQYHIDAEPQLIGLHFLAVNVGYLAAAATARRALAVLDARWLAAAGSLLSCASLVALMFVAPPVGLAWRLLALALAGIGAGTLAAALLYSTPKNLLPKAGYWASLLFGCGCLLSTAAIGGMYFSGHAETGTVVLAGVALTVLLSLAIRRANLRTSDVQLHGQSRNASHGVRSIAAALFGVLLFLQAGNEWAIAGWLPLYLVHRLGSNPALAIAVLAVFFLALLMGRIATHYVLPKVSHRYFLLASVIAAVGALLLLSFSASLGEAAGSAAMLGAAFAPIYPLLSERLDERFPFDPGFYNVSASLAITGAMCTQWLVGLFAGGLGMRYLLLFPALGSVLVLLLSLLFLFEAHLMRES